ncbi:MAG: adenylosuccinate synthase [Chloroflexota bacterium]|nr:adenylosuccinate synthase [Chloroflexota bacterium]
MPATIVMGGQWGDEGKGKLTDALAAQADVVVRANGGSNAGHTIETDRGVFKLHLIPSGILNPACLCVVGAGVVVDPGALLTEMDDLRARGVDISNLRVSDRAHVVMPYHPMLDRLEEQRRADDEIGTTLRGNGPAYADKAARRGLRIGDLLDPTALAAKLEREVGEKNRTLTAVYNRQGLDPAAVHQDLVALGERLSAHVAPSEKLVQDALAAGGEVVVECAQGAMLDIDYGTYPYVTSSSPTAAGACQGAGVAPTQVRRVIGVFKAYSTRVGAGPLPTELHDAIGERIRERGREYGTTTGRPRRIGWFDAVAARSVARLNGVTEVALTLLDVLDDLDEIEVCTGYRLGTVGGADAVTGDTPRTSRGAGPRPGAETIHHPPSTLEAWEAVRPVYETLPGWRQPTSGARTPEELPAAARAYVRFLEDALGAPVTMVGVGPNREQLVPLGRRGGAAVLAD